MPAADVLGTCCACRVLQELAQQSPQAVAGCRALAVHCTSLVCLLWQDLEVAAHDQLRALLLPPLTKVRSPAWLLLAPRLCC